jgi:hypothetical protein
LDHCCALSLALLLALAALACSKREEEPLSRPRGLTPAEAPPSQPPAQEESARNSAPKERAPHSLPSPFATGAPDPGALTNADASPGSAAAGATDDAAPARDLAAELAGLIGQPLSCVNFPAIVAGGGRLSIAVDAQVVPSGRITRAEVTAPGQPEEALRCIEKLVTAKSLRAPVPGAPRRVTTSVGLQVVANPP